MSKKTIDPQTRVMRDELGTLRKTRLLVWRDHRQEMRRIKKETNALARRKKTATANTVRVETQLARREKILLGRLGE